MTSLIIGDFRAAQLQYNNSANNFIFLWDDFAEYTWFENNIIEQLSQFSGSSANTIIMLGLNDCIYSCKWNTFNIEAIASSYAATINKLITDFTSHTFYVCSVNPVDSDYQLDGTIIKKATLNNKIEHFNTKLRSNCTATFIDSYHYLTTTGFATRDGVRYLPNTCNNILALIAGTVKQTIGGKSFQARTEMPWVDGDTECDLYWLSSDAGEESGGLNPFGSIGQPNSQSEFDTLPNCTAYAWGRWYELLGTSPKLSTDKVETWYNYTSDGYERGQEPKLGAVMCWKGTSSANTDGKGGRGHLAIVEKINLDGSIRTSESAYGDPDYWWTTDRTKDGGNWGQDSTYTFQGFIYCPNVSATGNVGDYINKSQLVTKNKYLTRAEQEINARYIWSYFGQKGWTLNAVAALLGNMQSESTLSPNLCERSSKVSSPSGDHPTAADIENYAYRYYNAHGRFPGYGLVQWTGQRYGGTKNDWSDQKFIYWCRQNRLDPADMDSQLERIHYESSVSVGWALARYNRGYTFRGESFDNITFKEFITSTKDPGWLAAAFAFCYEKPASSVPSKGKRDELCATRAGRAEAWYTFLSGLPSIAPAVLDEGMRFTNFKLDSCSSTYAMASFIANEVDIATYTLKQGIKTKATKEIEANNGFTRFKLSELIPDTTYRVAVTLQGGNNSISKSISFTTPQDFPESMSSISITTTDSALPYNNFKLSASPSNPDFGYWKDNDHGYTIQLIVNGQVKKEREVQSLPDSINILSYFGYKTKITDIIQLGIRTWVRQGLSKLYDSDYAVASNAICLLKNDFIAYLNKK